jgi:hypothetical protein
MAGRTQFRIDHPDAIVRELERVRQKLGCSQQRMAQALDVPFRTYQKWVCTDQKPRHGQALLDRAKALSTPRRVNCWEVLECGREPGGSKVDLDGPCPAAVDGGANGVNGGVNGGRVCWAISGTFCGMQVEGSEAQRLISCFVCDFFSQVLQEEGLANFKLLKPGQTYTQT